MHQYFTRFSVILFLSFLLGSCYSPCYRNGDEFHDGYKSCQIAPNVFKVDYVNRGLACRFEPAKEDMIKMIRAAELTLEHGYRYFAIVSNPIEYPNASWIFIECFHEKPEKRTIDAESLIRFNQICK